MSQLIRLNITVLVLLVLAYSCNCRARKLSDTDELDSLELLHVIFRHGDRTPDKSALYKNDPHFNVSYAPFGYGQLTNAGKRKEYQIGHALRKRYGDFLQKDFTLHTVDARSTDYNRTKMSLQLVLASLFPPKGHFVWKNRFNWQPVPFNYWPAKDDQVLADPYKNCPKYDEIFSDFLNSTEGQELYENHTEIIKYLQEKTGEDLKPKRFSDLYFTLTTERENGYQFPDWAEDYYKHITELAILDYKASTATDELKKLTAGFLVKKIVEDTLQKIKGSEIDKPTKIFLYSAHELNLAFVLRYFDIFHPHIPPYGSYITFEVHNFNGLRGIKIFYEDYTTASPQRMRIPGCDSFCRLDKFLKLYKNLLPISVHDCL